jgi:hypothetical protein
MAVHLDVVTASYPLHATDTRFPAVRRQLPNQEAARIADRRQCGGIVGRAAVG